MVAALDSGEIDIVLGPLADDLPGTCLAHPLAEDDLVAITPPGHRLGRAPEIALAELAGETFVCLPEGSGLRRLLDSAAGAAGLQPRVQFEATSPSSLRELVSAGVGVALTVASAADRPGPGVGVHRFTPACHPPYGLVPRRDRDLPAAARALRDHLVAAGIARVPPDRLLYQAHRRRIGRP
jgi:LysR family transcriptional regulator, transcription activator of glutamate synthase operon